MPLRNLSRQQKRRLLLLWGIGGPLVLLLAVGIIYFLWSPTVPAPKEAQQPPIVEQELHPTDLQQMQGWFGPWEMAAPNSTGSPALVLLRENGSVEVSSWTVPVDEQWHESKPFEVQAQTADEQQVKMRTNSGQIYTLSYDQPFVFASRPGQVYVYTKTGMEYELRTITTEQARQLGRHI